MKPLSLKNLKDKYPSFLIPLDEVEHFIHWYEKPGQITSSYDEEKYKFACDARLYLKGPYVSIQDFCDFKNAN